MSSYRISLIRGDGIGPEVVGACENVLLHASSLAGVSLKIVEVEAGDGCLEKRGEALPQVSIDIITGSDACLKGPVGRSAASVIVRLRQELELYANVRPARCLPGVPALDRAADFVIVRENTEDLYRGMEMEFDGGVLAFRPITKRASERIARFAFNMSSSRSLGKRVVCVHKNNVLKKSDGLFLSSFYGVAQDFPGIAADDMLVDSAAMNIVRKPSQFDVIVTTNLYGDILSDEAAQVVGGLGLAPSANIGERYAIFEPVHGSAPDIAGTGRANPTATMLTAAMMLEWLASTRGDGACWKAANLMRGGVDAALSSGARTRDLGGNMSTADFAADVIGKIT